VAQIAPHLKQGIPCYYSSKDNYRRNARSRATDSSSLSNEIKSTSAIRQFRKQDCESGGKRLKEYIDVNFRDEAGVKLGVTMVGK
jgi:GH25 family lysozyme M1 (1,4-beta-N-acetylmuramidase)